MKRILTILRSHRLVRPMTEEEAKSISIELLRPLALEHERALKAGLDDEDLLAAFRHLARMSSHSIRSSLTKGSLLLNLRLLVGSRKERAAIINGCLDASFELLLKPPAPTSSKGPTTH